VICNPKNSNFYKIDNGQGNTLSVVGAPNNQSTNQSGSQSAGQFQHRSQSTNNFQQNPFGQNGNWSFQPNHSSHVSSSTSNYSIRIDNNIGGKFLFKFRFKLLRVH